MTDNSFKFDLNAKKVRILDRELLESLQQFAKIKNNQYFPTTEFDKWNDKIARSDTIIDRFGSWNKALHIIGIEGGREKKYTSEELVENIENIWKDIGFPPGKRQLSKMGKKISERPYKDRWGSVKKACELISLYHTNKISRKQLLNPKENDDRRKTIPLNIRWRVLKRDNYACVKCGKSPAKNNDIELEIDHIIPVSKKGSNDVDNLQTLCRMCNQGKKDK